MVAQAVAAIALGLLAASGVAKLLDPEPTTGAMRAARLPAGNNVSYGLGVAESLTSIAALAIGGLAVVLAAVMYAGFSIFTVAAVKNRIPVQSCGCFGRDDTPPSSIHLAFNVAATGALVATYGLGLDPIEWGMAPLELGLYLLFAAIGVYATYLVMTSLPQTLQAARGS